MSRFVRSLLATTSLVVVISPAVAEERPAEHKVDVTRLSVDELVERLASPFPTPGLSSDGGFDPIAQVKFESHSHYSAPSAIVHPNVVAATNELVARGPDAILTLLKHTDDERYCWTGIFVGIRDYTVGRRVDDIIEDILRPEILLDYHAGEFREQPDFGTYLSRIGVTRYLEWFKSVTPRERELAYLHWHSAQIDRMRTGSTWTDPEESSWLDKYQAPYRKRIADLEAAGIRLKSTLSE